MFGDDRSRRGTIRNVEVFEPLEFLTGTAQQLDSELRYVDVDEYVMAL